MFNSFQRGRGKPYFSKKDVLVIPTVALFVRFFYANLSFTVHKIYHKSTVSSDVATYIFRHNNSSFDSRLLQHKFLRLSMFCVYLMNPAYPPNRGKSVCGSMAKALPKLSNWRFFWQFTPNIRWLRGTSYAIQSETCESPLRLQP